MDSGSAMNPPSRILVTGGAGFIGSHLCERLLEQGREVLVLDNFNDFYDPAIKRTNLKSLLAKGPCNLLEGDIRDQDRVEKAFSTFRPQAVVHLAAMAGVRPSIENPLLYCDINVNGTTVILEALRRHPVDNFVFGSSSSVYGVNDRLPFSEGDDLSKPVSPYAATKLAGEQLCYTYHHLFDLPVTCLRFFTVYGPRQRPEMAIHQFGRKILDGVPITVYGDGAQSRCFCDARDVVQAIIDLAQHPKAPGQVYNIGGTEEITIHKLAEQVKAITHSHSDIITIPYAEAYAPGFEDMQRRAPDTTRIHTLLGWQPRRSLDEILQTVMVYERDRHDQIADDK